MKAKKQAKKGSSKTPVKKKPPKITDRATVYATAVVNGDIIAGPYVRGSCQRHLNDLRRSASNDPTFPYYYDEHEAAEAIAFFEECLRLNGGQFEGLPFILLLWQCLVIGSIFGWKRNSDGMRRFRVVYVETAKGSGKSPLCAGVGIKGLVADNEPRAEIYAAATLRDQAMVLFRDAVAFYDQSEELQSRLTASGVGDNRWNLAYLDKGSFFRVISSDNKRGKSGPRPHMALIDEIHEHPDGNVIEMLRAGFKFRRQPLSFMITNSGHDKTTVCWEYHEMGCKVALEQIQNDELFSYICSLDEADLKDDAFLQNESSWIKVNPSLEAGIPGYDYIRGQVNEARNMPSKMATVKRLCFCIWTESDNPAFSAESWLACRDKDYPIDILAGRRCWGGLDLSAVDDLTSLALIFEPQAQPKFIVDEETQRQVLESFTDEEIAEHVANGLDPYWRLKVFFWIPSEGIGEKENAQHVPYIAWRENGSIFTSPGLAISKTQVVQFIDSEVAAKYDLQGIAYDRNRMKDLIEFASKGGIELDIGEWDKKNRVWIFSGRSGIKMMPFGQEGRSMAPAIDKFELFLLQKLFRHDGNPCLGWNVASAVIREDNDGYRKVMKNKSTGKVDGLVATVMAHGVIDDGPPQRSSFIGKSVEQIVADILM